MKIANRKNLKTYARELLGNEYCPETEKALIQECLYGFERETGHISHSHARHLERINKILNNYGVEGILEETDKGTIDIQYCNAGDTYALTLLYHKGKLKIGDWGTIVERYI